MAKAKKRSKKNAKKNAKGTERLTRLALSSGAVYVAKRATELTWRLGAQRKPPKSATDSSVTLGEALLWSALSGAAIATAKAWAARKAAEPSPLQWHSSAVGLAAAPSAERSSDES